MLKQDRALEILAAVQARAQNKVAIQQRARLAKKCEEILAHLGSAHALACWRRRRRLRGRFLMMLARWNGHP
jgi:hypothetical protein